MTRVQSMFLGIVVNVFMGFIVSLVLPVPGTLKGIPAGIEYFTGVGLAFFYFGYCGITLIPVGYHGVLKIFGERYPDTVYNEGYWYTLPWPFMEIEAVNTKQNVINLLDFEGMTQDGIRVRGKASVYYRIADPNQSLSVEEGVIDGGLRELMESALREALSAVPLDTLINDYQGAENSMRTRMRDEADQRADVWGIEIADVKISNLKPDEEVMEQYERIKREEKERQAELTEAQGVKERIDLYQGSALTPVEARDTDQVERGKTKKDIKETRIGVSEEIKDIAVAVTEILMRGR